MRAKQNLLSALVVGTLGGVIATGCQTYDFEPVEPLAISQTTETRRIEARERKPNMMLLVDTSGSMTAPADPSLAACKRNGVVCGDDTFQCPISSGCDTRWSALQKAMTDFLGSSGTIARLGLATYPADDYCGSTASVSIPLPAADKEDNATLTANAQAVLNQLLAIKTYRTTATDKVPDGGTPTSLSLRYVGGIADLQTEERSDFVLLLTDGLPNCNPSHPTTPTQCYCTLSVGCTDTPEGCLDKNTSVAAVQQLSAKNIKTIVIGFGADFNATSESGRQGAATLNAMAEAGGFARKCTQDADCGAGDTCDTAAKLCSRRFYQAANRAELVAALQQIGRIVGTDPCVLTFDPTQRPDSEELLVVYLNNERLEPGPDTWTTTKATENNQEVITGLKFSGTTCQRLENSSPANPVDLEVRAVQRR
jgi:hypothetical protein